MDPVYVQRDSTGAVCGVYALLQPGYAEEHISADDPAVVAFLNPKPPLPRIISDRQFFQQLAVQGVITQDDALAAVKTGTLPPALGQLVAALPSDQQFDANMLLCGATTFDRSHPMVAVLGQAFGWTDAHLDALWTAAAAL